MPARISDEKRKQVIKLWLLGKTWAEIHRTTGVSTGEISNILADYKKRLDDSDLRSSKIFIQC